MEPIHPSLVYLLGAALLPFLRGRLRQAVALLIPAWALFNFFQLESGLTWTFRILDFSLVPGRVDSWTFVFLNVFTILSGAGILYLLRDNRALDLSAGLLYAGSAMGVVLAGDLVSLFLFWELLTLAALLCILARKTPAAGAAAYRYLLVHVAGGVVLLAGIVLHVAETGSIAFTRIELGSTASYLIFLGFGLNCAWPIIGAWLPDTYPEASIGGVVFMATFTTKTAVYVLARAFPGEPALLWIGLAMALIPLFYAAIENDLRRVLAHCLVNQVGFMVLAIGLGTPLALNGAAAHAYCHILYKALLFMAIGAVILQTGKSKASDLGGLRLSMPWTCLLCCLGAAGSAVPLFGGFVSKSIILSAVAEEHRQLLWLALVFASAGAFYHLGLRVPYSAFFGRDSGIRCQEAPWNMRAAMAIIALISLLTGSFPHLFLQPWLPTPDLVYQPYTLGHLTAQFSLLAFCALAFTFLLRSGLAPANLPAINLQADWLWRRSTRLFYRLMDQAWNGANRLASRLIVQHFIPFLRDLLEAAPSRTALAILQRITPSRPAGANFPAPNLQAQAQKGALPIGLTACLAVLFLALLFLL